PSARALLEVLAVAGKALPQELAARAAELPPERFDTIAVELRAGCLIRTGGARPRDPIELYHDRIRESVLAHLAPEVKQRVHAALARALEAEATPDIEA